MTDWFAIRAAACYDAKTIVKAAIKRMEYNPKGYPEFFMMRRVLDYLQRQATEAEALQEDVHSRCGFPTVAKSKQVWCDQCHAWTDPKNL